MKQLLEKGQHSKRLTQEQGLGASLNVAWPLDSLVVSVIVRADNHFGKAPHGV